MVIKMAEGIEGLVKTKKYVIIFIIIGVGLMIGGYVLTYVGSTLNTTGTATLQSTVINGFNNLGKVVFGIGIAVVVIELAAYMLERLSKGFGME